MQLTVHYRQINGMNRVTKIYIDFLSSELFCQLEDVDFFIPSIDSQSINYPPGTSNSIWESSIVSKMNETSGWGAYELVSREWVLSIFPLHMVIVLPTVARFMYTAYVFTYLRYSLLVSESIAEWNSMTCKNREAMNSDE